MASDGNRAAGAHCEFSRGEDSAGSNGEESGKSMSIRTRLREWLGIAAIWDEIQKRQEAQKALSSAVEDLRASLDTSKSETSALYEASKAQGCELLERTNINEKAVGKVGENVYYIAGLLELSNNRMKAIETEQGASAKALATILSRSEALATEKERDRCLNVVMQSEVKFLRDDCRAVLAALIEAK